MFKKALIKSAKNLLKLEKERAIAGFALIGGMALASYLKPRATGDIDYVVFLEDQDIADVGKKLKGKVSKGDIFDPIAATISYDIQISSQSVPIQIVEFHSAIQEITFKNRDIIKFENIKIPVINPKGLIILKLYAGGPVDMIDAQKLFELKSLKSKDKKYIEDKAKKLRLFNRFQKLSKRLN